MEVHHGGGVMRAILLSLLGCAALCQWANAAVEVRPVREDGRYVGFDLVCDGQVVAPVRLGTRSGPKGQRLITAGGANVTRSGGTSITFTGLASPKESGLSFGEDDYVQVSLPKGERYPRLSFRLTITRFNPDAWQAFAGKCPFHFLAVYLPEAEVWHQRGWLNATPLADPFPLLIDPHAGSPEIASTYSRNWSYTPPLGAQPVPVIGLWAPKRKLYVGMEFQSTRLADNSEKDIATGYCWRSGADRQFVALVYPYGGVGYQKLVFPEPGARIASRCVLLFSTSMPSDADPNQFVWQYVWNRYRRALPTAPVSNDLSWIPGGAHLRDFEGPPGPDLVSTAGPGDPFVVEGTKTVAGWYRHKESVVDALAAVPDERALSVLAADLRYVLGKAKTVQTPYGTAVFWEKPLEGRWNDAFGGTPVTTLHNTDAWYLGRVFLDLYRNRKAPAIAKLLSDVGLSEGRLLEIVQGVLVWTRSFVFTRNEFADVPSSPFAIGGTLSAAFCLDYYFAFRGDPKRTQDARRALELAKAVTYRYLTMWMSDSNRADGLDSAFLWEPNSGRDWCGAACANEVHWNLDTLAMVAVHTGDPMLIHALRGTLERWPQLYKERYRASIQNYEHDSMTEGFGLYEGNVYGGVGARASYGTASALPMLDPVGDSKVRVLCGLRAALAFDRGQGHTKLVGYQCRVSEQGDEASFTFAVQTKHTAPFDLSLTAPFVPISGARVYIERGGRWEAMPDDAVARPRQAKWSLYIRRLRSGDRIMVTTAKAATALLAGPTTPPMPHPSAPPSVPPFRLVRLERAQPVSRDWGKLDSWAGLWEGLHWRYGVPFFIAASDDGPTAAGDRVEIGEAAPGPAAVFLAYGYTAGARPSVEVQLSDGTLQELTFGTDAEALAWRAWPPPFTAKLLLAKVDIQAGMRAVAVRPNGCPLFAVTVLERKPATEAAGAAISNAIAIASREWDEVLKQTEEDSRLRERMGKLALSKLAILPPGLGSTPFSLFLGRVGIENTAAKLSAQQIVDPSEFNADKYPVAVFSPDGEEYVRSVRREGDAAEALIRYVKEGGLLIVAANGPYPLYYERRGGTTAPHPLMPELGMPLKVVFEQPPQGVALSVVGNQQQSMAPSMPERLPFPPGDPRLRTVDTAGLPEGAAYTWLCRVEDDRGGGYGDAAAVLLWPGSGGRRGGVAYVWFGLWRDAKLARALADAIVALIEERLSQ